MTYVEPQRAEWEKTHKPTCNFYPCYMWRQIHWHVGCNHKTNRWDKCKYCRQKLDRLATLKGDTKEQSNGKELL